MSCCRKLILLFWQVAPQKSHCIYFGGESRFRIWCTASSTWPVCPLGKLQGVQQGACDVLVFCRISWPQSQNNGLYLFNPVERGFFRTGKDCGAFEAEGKFTRVQWCIEDPCEDKCQPVRALKPECHKLSGPDSFLISYRGGDASSSQILSAGGRVCRLKTT